MKTKKTKVKRKSVRKRWRVHSAKKAAVENEEFSFLVVPVNRRSFLFLLSFTLDQRDKFSLFFSSNVGRNKSEKIVDSRWTNAFEKRQFESADFIETAPRNFDQIWWKTFNTKNFTSENRSKRQGDSRRKTLRFKCEQLSISNSDPNVFITDSNKTIKTSWTNASSKVFLVFEEQKKISSEVHFSVEYLLEKNIEFIVE